ncbi:hypothetical protein PT974_02784 [Cladobotryum mycophilum]|uniref:Uncharacterized protein n=1 Tax=Cladobotryum mycophilum TaxID=491253 RepID=A0ABR0SZ79_9HYPO
MSREDNSTVKVFVKFKQHVDSNVSSGIHTLLGIPRSPEPSEALSSSSSSSTHQTGLPISKGTNLNPSSTYSIQSHPTTMDIMNMEKRPSQLDLFSVASWSYAPLNLRHLRPPVPNDLPSHHDAAIFTFEDAFEDLLVISQGNPLPDISTRVGQRKLLRQMYPNGEPMWFWLRRLESQGLLRRPRLDEMYRLDGFGPFSRQNESEFFQPHGLDWESFHNQLERRASDVWRRDSVADNGQSTGDFSDEAHKVSRNLEDGLTRHNPASVDESDSRHDAQQKGFPDNFDDIFSSITSSFAEGQKTWDTFVKSILENKSFPTNGSHQTTKHDKNGNKETVTQDEYVDRFGYLHTTVTRKTFDKDGREIGSQTHFTMRPADKRPNRSEEPEGNDANVIERTDSDDDGQQKPDKKQGWFWK